MRRNIGTFGLVGALGLAFLAGSVGPGRSQEPAPPNPFGKPKSIIHVVIIQWKADSTPEERQQALQGVEEMAAAIPGIRNLWTRSTRVQPQEFHAAFVIEFEDPAAAEAYVNHPAHRAWEKIYLPIREQSRSQQITN